MDWWELSESDTCKGIFREERVCYRGRRPLSRGRFFCYEKGQQEIFFFFDWWLGEQAAKDGRRNVLGEVF